MAPFDLHVLGMPPAFVLSQDQTLNKISVRSLDRFDSFYRAQLTQFGLSFFNLLYLEVCEKLFLIVSDYWFH